MGAAKSKNVADAVTDVMNYVQNSTSADSTTVNNIENYITLNNCYIKLTGDFTVKTQATVMQQASQILVATQDSTVKNDIVQKMLQEATSKVGSLGIGYAEASNEVSMLCNVTNKIIQTMQASIKQVSTTYNGFSCNDSTIEAKNLNISFTNADSFVSEQTLDNQQTTDIINQVTQESTQKASATVQGLAGFLIALALVIAALGYAVAKPIAAGSKAIMIPLIIVVMILIFVWLYMVKCPPFFSDYTYVSVNNPQWGGDCSSDDLVEPQKMTVDLKEAPLRYNFPITNSFLPKEERGSLLSFYIASLRKDSTIKTRENGGYNSATFSQISTDLSDSGYFWNADRDGTLMKLMFADEINDNEGLDLVTALSVPCPLLPINKGVDGKSRYPKVAESFANSCNPQIVQFPGVSMDNTGNVTSNSTLQIFTGTDPCKFTDDTFDQSSNTCTGGSASEEGSIEGCMNPCCNTSQFHIDTWVADDDKFYDTTFDPDSTKQICQLNIDGINQWLVEGPPGGYKGDEDRFKLKKQLYLRYLLCSKIGIPNLDVYIDEDEIVNIPDPDQPTKVIENTAKNVKDKAYFFRPTLSTNVTQSGGYANAIQSGGTVTGMFGICNNQTYKFQKFCKQAGGYIFIAFVVLIILFILLKGTRFIPHRKPTKQVNTKTQEKKQ